MRHHRRTNENNVDLNRNTLSSEMWSNVRKRDPNFVGYVDMDMNTLNPFIPVDEDGNLFSWVDAAREGGFDGDVTKLHEQDEEVRNAASAYDHTANYPQHRVSLREPDETINTWLDEKSNILQVFGSCISAILRLGYTAAKRGFVSSQYHKQSGVFYGGGAHNTDKWENSVFAVQHAIYKFAGLDFSSDSDRTLWIDVHTGLGKYGDYSILRAGGNDRGDDSVSSNWISKFSSLLDNQSNNDPSVSSGYDQTTGFINGPILCPPPNCFSMSQEFGTRPSVAVAMALILENKGQHDSASGGRRYGHLTSWAFYPMRLSWRRKALRGGMDMLRLALNF